jgi:prepilin-type N-terminal cleavage/methylation domain-containing protein
MRKRMFMTTSTIRRKNPVGFSLVEMLVVITVLVVLLSMLLPAINGARYAARQTLCGSNLRGLISASLAYSNDYKGDVPYGGFDSYGRGCFSSDTRKILYLQYGVSTPKQWWCPLDFFATQNDYILRTKYGLDPRWFTDSTWSPNGLDWTENHRNQQGYNYFIGPGRAVGDPSASIQYNMAAAKKFRNVPRPSLRQVWIDNLKDLGTTAGGVSGGWQHPCNTHNRGREGFPDGSMNAMADGHVEFRQYIWGQNTTAVSEWISQTFTY